METLKANQWPEGVPLFEEIRIENTNHCSHKCFFCPREKLTRELGFMPIENLAKVLSQFHEFDGQVDLHGFGEPLLDKYLGKKIKLVKARWPRSRTRIYSTLGISLKASQMEELIDAGLDIIEVSFYGYNKDSYKLTHGVDKFETARSNLFTLCQINNEKGGALKIIMRDFPEHENIKQPGLEDEKLKAFKIWLKEIGVSEIHTRMLHNYGNGRDYNTIQSKETCSITWGYRKRVLQVTWDLKIIPCCFDFNANIILGNLNQNSISEIFQSGIYTEFIDAHVENKLAAYPVCDSCERCFKA